MSKRTSGLGRGLGDLLADNSPEIRGGATVIRRSEDGEATITPDVSDGVREPFETENYENIAQNVENDDQISKNEESLTENSAHNTPIVIGSRSPSEQNIYSDIYYSGASVTEERQSSRRSLKALFKSYK